MHNRFVVGICDAACQKRLLPDAKLTMTTAFDIVQGIETEDLQSKWLNGCNSILTLLLQNLVSLICTHSRRAIFVVAPRSTLANICKFHQTKYLQCRKVGHLKHVCRSKAKQPPSVPTVIEKEQYSTLNAVIANHSQSHVSPLRQTSQLSRFDRESHDFRALLTAGSLISAISHDE